MDSETRILEGERSAFYGGEHETTDDIVERCYDAGYDIRPRGTYEPQAWNSTI